jgi:hypothetical protein
MMESLQVLLRKRKIKFHPLERRIRFEIEFICRIYFNLSFLAAFLILLISLAKLPYLPSLTSNMLTILLKAIKIMSLVYFLETVLPLFGRWLMQ